ncbi:MAG: (2Fe-2S)-binding protein [Bryobacteraceae bacterium]
MPAVTLRVNGESHTVNVDDLEMPLLYVLHEDLKLNGPKFGCGLGQCGACTVLLDGEPIRSCITPASDASGKNVLTIDGLATAAGPHPIQTAFVGEQAVQCGYCLSGVILYGMTTVDKNPNATEAEILKGMDGILCRCCTHSRMVAAIKRYQQEKRA